MFQRRSRKLFYEELRPVVVDEDEQLRDVIVDQDEKYHRNIFLSEERTREIKTFIETSRCYDGKRWHRIPVQVDRDQELYEPFSKLLQHIFEYFGYASLGRLFLDTHDASLYHKDGSTTAPSFMVMGSGPNFPLTEREEKGPSILPCYRRCASPGYIKREKAKLKFRNTAQIAVYARQCFIEQPNRRFVYSVMLTEANLCLFMFDRSGVTRSRFVNIHTDPEDFVRIILGFCSPSDEQIGFDTSIFWKKKEKVPHLGAENVPKWRVIKSGTVDALGDKPVSNVDTAEEDEPNDDEAEPDDDGDEPDGDEDESDDDEDESDDDEDELNGDEDESNDDEDQPDGDEDESDGNDEEDGPSQKRKRNDPKSNFWKAAKKRRQEDQEDISRRYNQFIRLNNHWDRNDLGEKVYQVQDELYSSRSLLGRGTRCWTVLDPDKEGNLLVIKDSWRSLNLKREATLLTKVVGLDGVGQMVAFQEDDSDRVSRFRNTMAPFKDKSTDLDRTFSRMALQKYGKTLEHFKSPLHLLRAFRDAVKGHRNLWARNILHRDVSLGNILYGKDGALEGNEGILIDLDLAIEFDLDSERERGIQTGTLAFQSINVANTWQYREHTQPHDHLDDLESFFYCMAMICWTFTAPGTSIEPPTEVKAWEDRGRGKILSLAFPASYLTPYFRCLEPLFRSMAGFLLEHAFRKTDLSEEARKEAKLAAKKHSSAPNVADQEDEGVSKKGDLPNQKQEFQEKLEQIKRDSEGHYNTFIGFIDEAIDSLLPPTTKPTSYDSLSVRPQDEDEVQSTDPSGPSKRRRPDDVDDSETADHPAQKKGCLRSPGFS